MSTMMMKFEAETISFLDVKENEAFVVPGVSDTVFLYVDDGFIITFYLKEGTINYLTEEEFLEEYNASNQPEELAVELCNAQFTFSRKVKRG